MKLKLIKNAFHLKNTGYSISIDRTIEERNSYKALLNQKKEEMQNRRNVGGMGIQNLRPSLGSKNYKNQDEAMLTKSTKNPKKLFIFYTNADNMISKRKEIQSLVSINNPDVFCMTETLLKNVLLKIECEIQIDGYDCFSNINNSNCHRGVAIYTKRYLNARSYLTNVKDFQEHACRKIELSDKTSLHILCLYRSPNNTS